MNERGETMSKKNKNESPNKGLTALIICGILSLAIIIGCVFFPEEIFGIFLK